MTAATITAVLKRLRHEADGVFGELSLRDDTGRELKLCTAEIPQPPVKPGRYLVRMKRSPKFGKDLYEVEDVEGHDGILIHAGNWAVPHSGKDADSHGCVLVGMAHGILDRKRAVLRSALALHQLHEWTKGATFSLTVVDK